MYTDFFGFNAKPFSLVPNPNYLYLSTKHGHALTFLEYGLSEKIGFVMLTGEIGIGKTTLIRYMLNQVEADMDVAVIFNTNIRSHDLINLILSEFEIEYNNIMGSGLPYCTYLVFDSLHFLLHRRFLCHLVTYRLDLPAHAWHAPVKVYCKIGQQIMAMVQADHCRHRPCLGQMP